ncbi:2-dehydro-3-deoxygalactonokinase [Roseomonas sp. CCTCC AB2023176]|uniref:2-dehydro-3-deoxygalactonokinase n=1 Tax=Roseomonas sp. CCTCC AB2023176 TaxID=3342640 RepID=UPI0035D737BD
MIAVDWGTTSLRAWRLGVDGAVLDSVDRQGGGILSVPEGGFPAAFRDALGHWLAEGEAEVLICGMAGSRQGWVEAPYLPCPAGAAEIAAAVVAVPFEEARVRMVPGLTGHDGSGVPEVMRGEETKLVGLAATCVADATVVMPGTHGKWARLRGRRVEGFTTHMTGDVFAALTKATILARTIELDAPPDWEAFDRGAARARQDGGLLHHLFGTRTLHLVDGMTPAESTSYLSGLLIGHEVAAAGGDGPVELIGSDALVERYARVLGPRATRRDGEDLVLAGLAAIAAGGRA